nr:aspartate/glutamate racemase family protein [Phenylobacterium sp.]
MNPNASEAVTGAIRSSARGVSLSPGIEVVAVTNLHGPPGIETDDHVAAVGPDLERMIEAQEADAYVIACFSDPGVDRLRAATGRPVIGIAEAAYQMGAGLGGRFGVISIVQASISRHRARLESLGLVARLAGDRAINVGVTDLGGSEVAARLLEVARGLTDDGADSVILGCAGLGDYRLALQQALRRPVIDPVQVALAQAHTVLSLGLHRPL